MDPTGPDADLTAPVAPRAGRREWIGLAVLALPCLLYAMDLTVLHLAVPQLSADLQPSSAQLLWIIDIYGFLVAGSLITMGTLGDRIGRRRLLLIGAAAFGVASVLAAFSTSAEMLIASPGAAGRRRGDPGAVHAVADPQHVPRPAAAHGRHRGLDHQLLGRRRDRPAARRGPAGVLLVGLGVPAGGAGDGAAAGARAAAAAGVPRSRRGPAGPGQRGAVAGRGAGDDLRPQADRPGRPRLARRLCRSLVGLAVGVAVRAPAAARWPTR